MLKNCDNGEIVSIGNGASVRVTCSCPVGQIRQEGECRELFTQGSCAAGNILVASEEHSCPEQFHCAKHIDCESFQLAKKEVNEVSGTLRTTVKRHLKKLVCDDDGQKICCPQNSTASLLSPENIMQSFIFKQPSPLCIPFEVKLSYSRTEDIASENQWTQVGSQLRRKARLLADTPTCRRRSWWNPYTKRCTRVYT